MESHELVYIHGFQQMHPITSVVPSLFTFHFHVSPQWSSESLFKNGVPISFMFSAN